MQVVNEALCRTTSPTLSHIDYMTVRGHSLCCW